MLAYSCYSVQYDCLVFDGKEHVRIATLPGMWERTVSVYSAGSECCHLMSISIEYITSCVLNTNVILLRAILSQRRLLRQAGVSVGSSAQNG